MIGLSSAGSVGSISVQTTSGRGATPEEVASRCVKKVISIADTADPAIRDQAQAFSNQVEAVIAHYMKEAIKSDRTTLYNILINSGQTELAEHIRRI